MISFVTTFKPFNPPLDVIQLNALKSWLRFCPPCEVIVVGSESGIDKVIRKFEHIRFVPDVKRSPTGTPLLNDLMIRAEKQALNDIICLINGDIILLSDFIKSVEVVKKTFKDFFLTCRRIDVIVNKDLDFNLESTEKFLLSLAEEAGRVKKPKGTDLFVYKKGFFDSVPPFAIGRLVWSRWLIYYALSKGIPVIDATGAITAIHQLHGYRHIREERVKKAMAKGLEGYDAIVLGKEYRMNAYLAGVAAYFSEEDCNYLLSKSGLVKRKEISFLLRYLIKKPLLTRYTTQPAMVVSRVLLPSKLLRSVLKKELLRRGLFY